MLGNGNSKLNLRTPEGSEIRDELMWGFHFVMGIGEIEKLEERYVSLGGIEGGNESLFTFGVQKQINACRERTER